jgi:integrase
MTGARAVKLDMDYLYRQTDRNGKWFYYFRRNGKKTRLPAPSDPAFHAAYAKALGSTSNVKERKPKASAGKHGSIKWLCERYYQTAEFKVLASSTQRVRRGILDNILSEEWRTSGRAFGAFRFADVKPLHVREIKDAKADLPEAANARIKALRQVFTWAKKAGHVETNPALEVGYVHSKTDGHHTWTVAEVYQFWEKWPLGTREYLASCILLFTGVRRQDAPRLGRGMERDGELSFRAGKNGMQIDVPVVNMLREAIEASPSGHMTYLVTEFGKPFTAAGFGNWFGERCRKAGVPGRAHGLRKAGACILAENGATDHELMSIYGWTTLKQAGLYTRKANRARLARSGIQKLTLANKDPMRKAE